MPRIIDYPQVQREMTALGLRCLYHNSGAFGFETSDQPLTCGWIGPDDPTIRPEAMANVVRVSLPHSRSLARRLETLWLTTLRAPFWIMPASHWAYEMEFGNGPW